MAATALANLAQVIMDLAIAINTTAFQPGMLDQTEQSLIVFSPSRFRFGQPRVVAAGMNLQRLAKPSNGVVVR